MTDPDIVIEADEPIEIEEPVQIEKTLDAVEPDNTTEQVLPTDPEISTESV